MANCELTQEAEKDLDGIFEYTLDQWGLDQAKLYQKQLNEAFSAIAEGKALTRIFVKERPDLRVLHAQHHYVFYLIEGGKVPLVIAVFHERMDLLTRMKERLGTG
jgi:toxin ParE1/3/4